MELGVLAGSLGVLRRLICLPASAEEACAEVDLCGIHWLSLDFHEKQQINVGKQLLPHSEEKWQQEIKTTKTIKFHNAQFGII